MTALLRRAPKHKPEPAALRPPSAQSQTRSSAVAFPKTTGVALCLVALVGVSHCFITIVNSDREDQSEEDYKSAESQSYGYSHRPHKPQVYQPVPHESDEEEEAPPTPKPQSQKMSVKFDVPSLKIEMPPLRLPSYSLKATLKKRNRPMLFSLLQMLPRITIDGTAGLSANVGY
ncbi:hypothetical protein HDE_13257 [Halotydeus destructor]|nr:hypothetical protein HDE_13257 [Halotydeus destructor]